MTITANITECIPPAAFLGFLDGGGGSRNDDGVEGKRYGVGGVFPFPQELGDNKFLILLNENDAFCISLFAKRSSMKLATNICHVSRNKGKWFQGQRSKVEVVGIPFMETL